MNSNLSKSLSVVDLPKKTKNYLLLSAGIFLVAAWFSIGYNQSDEHFQLFEFAGLKLGINTEHNLAWEYGQQMRPTLQVGMIVLMHKVLGVFGIDNPFVIAWIFRVLSAAFSFFIALFFYKIWVEKFKDDSLKWTFFLLSFFLWVLFYNGVRFNSEMWSGHCFALAAGLFWYWKTPDRWQYLGLGVLVGLSFLFRYQAAFMIAGWGLWLIFIKKESWDKLALFTLGGLLMAALGILIDRWFYGEWTLSLWNYFEQNILLDKASNFGVDPWWHYFYTLLIKGIPPFSLVYLSVLFFYIWKFPKSLITWASVFFIGIHLLIAHKELRFFYPLLPFLPIVIVQCMELIHQTISPSFWERKGWRIFIKFFWVHNAILTLFIAFWPVIAEISIQKTIYDEYKKDITIYGVNDSPYRVALYMQYYKRQNLCVMEVDTVSNLPIHGQDKYLIALDKRTFKEWPDIPGERKLVYSTFPDWIYYFNVGDWLRRSQWWLVYEIDPRGK